MTNKVGVTAIDSLVTAATIGQIFDWLLLAVCLLTILICIDFDQLTVHCNVTIGHISVAD